ncbi:MAG TPA: hypothetical protein VM939_13725 [Gemmatimonadaceae bacterium]|nr:hypothetical protein [Gemmatimonadaceae bacterium]
MASQLLDAPISAERVRFPTLPAILLGLCLCLHLAAVIHSLLGKTTAGATCFFLGQCALALALLRLINGAWIFQDIRFMFVLFFTLYGGTLPLILSMQNGSLPGLAQAAFLYGTGMTGFNLVQWWYKQPWRDVRTATFNAIRPTFWNLSLIATAFALVIAYASFMGVSFAFAIDRSQTRFIGGQLWIVLMFFVNGMAMFMFAGWPRLNRTARVIVVLSTVAFVLFHISLGNRRDFLPMFIFLAALVATRRHSIIRFGTMVIGFAAFAGLTLFGVVRQVIMDPRLLANNPVQLLLGNNEFVSPIQTLMYYAIDPNPLRLGFTYLAAPSLFIPRVYWPGKPESLSITFLRDAFGTTQTIGFAYTPVTEAFINFGWVGPFLVLCLLSLLMIWLVRNVDSYTGLYFIAFALVLDFNRGEFGGTFYSLVCVGAGYAMMQFVSKLRWGPARGSTTHVVPLGATSVSRGPSPEY